MYFHQYKRKTYFSRETKTPFGSRDRVRFNAERKLIRGWAKVTWTASDGWLFQLFLKKRPREGAARQTAKLVDARRRRIPKPFVQHVLEIVGWRLLIIDDGAVLKDSQIILRWPQKLLHSGFHTRFHSGKQFERAVIATNGDVPFTHLKNLHISFQYLIVLTSQFMRGLLLVKIHSFKGFNILPWHTGWNNTDTREISAPSLASIPVSALSPRRTSNGFETQSDRFPTANLETCNPETL